MKYIKHSDPFALANKLRTFSRSLEDIVLLLKELNDDKHESLRRHFKDENNITIYYKYAGTKILKISLRHNKDNTVSMVFLLFKNNWIPNHLYENIKDFYNYTKLDLSNYIFTESEGPHKRYKSTRYKFDYTECNNILKLLNSFEIYTNSMKYNL